MTSKKSKKKSIFELEAFLTGITHGKTAVDFAKKQVVFTQGDPSDAIFYVKSGRFKLTVTSRSGKEATVALLGSGDFLGEECIATSHPVRVATATAMAAGVAFRVEKQAMIKALRKEHALSEFFVAYLLARNLRIQEDLVDQLFNSSEKRLARILLLLAQFGKEGTPETIIPRISQETLAEMVGTTRARVNFFMNRFRKLGFIHYNGGVQVHSSLLNIILHD